MSSMKLPQLLYNKTDIFILLCLRFSLYCPLQGAAVVGGHKGWGPVASTNTTLGDSGTVDMILDVLTYNLL